MLNKLIKLIPVIYKDLPNTIKGRSWGLWIEIQPKHKDDLGLLAHERCHVRQFFTYPFVYGLLYKFSSKFRYKFEVEAFGYSIAYGNRTKENVRSSLASYYNIPEDVMKYFTADITYAIENAKKDLDELSS